MSEPQASVPLDNQEVAPWAAEELALRQVLARWIARSIRAQRDVPYRGGKGGHDEGSFTTSWCGYYQLTGEPDVLAFMRDLRDQYLAYAEQHQVHGYDDWGEVHHQTEHYSIFLTRLWHLDPTDARTVAALEHAAHHVGNWEPGVPAWYDWQSHRFRSWSIGTRLVQDYPPYDFNVPDHFKLLHIVLSAYLATGRARYLELCCDYAGHWANLILQAPEELPPAVLFARECPPTELEQLYAGAAANPLALYHSPSREQRTEQHVAAGSLEMFLDLYQLTGEERYLAAVRRMLPPILAALADPNADIPVMLLSKYRWIAGDTAYDQDILAAVEREQEQDYSRMALLVGVISERGPIVGRIGRRADQVHWVYQADDGTFQPERGASPGAWMLAYEITGDTRYATQALAKARRRLELATFALRDGREHGCAAHTIHAVAAGHGRGTGAGCVTTTLYPFALGAHRYAGADRLAVRYRQQNGQPGLPAGIAARWIPVANQVQVELVNTGTEAVTVGVLPGDMPGMDDARTQWVIVPPHGVVRVVPLPGAALSALR